MSGNNHAVTTEEANGSDGSAPMQSGGATPLCDFKFPGKKDEDDDKTKEQVIDDIPMTVPLISLKQGLNKKADPLALSSWVKLALTLDGRDKITKVCQYSSRMLAWWFAGTNQMQRFKALQTSLTNSRKAFRLGRSLIEVQKIRDSGFLEIFFGPEGKQGESWRVIGNALKMIGLMGFWAGDNVNFLSMSGLFDDYRPEVSAKERLEKRNQLKTNASLFANRFYFFGAIAGFVTGLRAYWTFRQTKMREAHQRLLEATKNVAESSETERTNNMKLLEEAKKEFESAREKQFGIFLTFLKSCCDVMVFSNNPGIDLWKKYRGKKNHEGFHCLCGLLSASTVLYNSYPNNTNKE